MTQITCFLFFIFAPAASSMTMHKTAFKVRPDDSKFIVRLDTLTDLSRNRQIPIAIYQPQSDPTTGPQKVIIFSHGYGQNKGGDYIAYSYLTEYLASKGYFVASIQHELPTDSLLPLTGIPQIVRRTNWERGAANILFVLNELKKSNPNTDQQHTVLIGHSNGGDMSMLFAQKYPSSVDRVISLDNRRVAFPRTKKPRIYSLRSNDQVADEGVLPTPEEQAKYQIKIVPLANTAHNDMDDHANHAQREEIRHLIMSFLKD